MLYWYEQSYLPKRVDRARWGSWRAREGRWCDDAFEVASLAPSASPTASPTLSPSPLSEWIGNATGAAGGSVGIVAATGGGQGAGAGANMVVDVLAEAVPEVGFENAMAQAGPNLASGVGSMQTMHVITGVCDSALLEEAVVRHETRRRLAAAGLGHRISQRRLEEEARTDEAHQEMRKEQQTLAWTNFRVAIWGIDERRIWETGRLDLKHWIEGQEKAHARRRRRLKFGGNLRGHLEQSEQRHKLRQQRRLLQNHTTTEEDEDEDGDEGARLGEPVLLHRAMRRLWEAGRSYGPPYRRQSRSLQSFNPVEQAAGELRGDVVEESARGGVPLEFEEEQPPLLGANPADFMVQELKDKHLAFETTM